MHQVVNFQSPLVVVHAEGNGLLDPGATVDSMGAADILVVGRLGPLDDTSVRVTSGWRMRMEDLETRPRGRAADRTHEQSKAAFETWLQRTRSTEG